MEALIKNGSQIKLNTEVKTIAYTKNGVVVTAETHNGSEVYEGVACLVTVAIGVL